MIKENRCSYSPRVKVFLKQEIKPKRKIVIPSFFFTIKNKNKNFNHAYEVVNDIDHVRDNTTRDPPSDKQTCNTD